MSRFKPDTIEKMRIAALNRKTPHPMLGRHHSDEAKRKIAEKRIGKHTPHSEETKQKMRHRHKPMRDEVKKNQRRNVWAEKNPRWKGGITPINHKIRTSLEYKIWRKAVFERDNYTCIWCGDDRGGNLEADHIKPFAFYPELRFAIDNGRTLCSPCHKTTDTYGSRKL